MATGPLAGIRIVELSAIGPVPHAGMLLSDLGADIIRIDRSGGIALPDRNDPREWPELTELLSMIFSTRKRDEWAEIFSETDACVTPVLTFAEAESDPHLAARQSVQRYGDVLQASPAPRFERHVLGTPAPPPTPDADRAAILADWLGER